MPASDDYERVQPRTRAEWRRWLAKHHDSAPGVWFVGWKKGSGGVSPSYEEQVEEALCFGWIDSRLQPIDEQRAALLYTPRKPKSAWAATNKARVERVVAEGLMQPAGLVKIEAAKRDGSWDALNDVEALRVPDDLARALRAAPGARAHWDAFPPSARKQILGWIASAKRPETRARRIAEATERAAENLRPGPLTPGHRRG